MVTQFTKLAWPELSCLEMRSINDEGIFTFQVGGCSLETLHIGSMGQLSLTIAANHFELLNLRQPLLTLLVSGQQSDGLVECMEIHR